MTVADKLRIPPPPIPWIALPARRPWILGATAPMIEPMKKTAMVVRRMGLRPKMSLIFPHGGVAAV